MATRGFDVGPRFRVRGSDGRFGKTPTEFIDFVLEKMGDEALRRTRPHVKSATLRRSLRSRKDPENSRRIIIDTPYYWALYAHDGRKEHGPRKQKVIIFFENKTDDPRTDLSLNYPKTVGARRGMRQFKTAYENGLKQNSLRRRAASLSGGDYRPFMIVVPLVGPARANPFFDIGLAGFEGDAKDLLAGFTKSWITEQINSALE
jgi:hypothetical protein